MHASKPQQQLLLLHHTALPLLLLLLLLLSRLLLPSRTIKSEPKCSKSTRRNWQRWIGVCARACVRVCVCFCSRVLARIRAHARQSPPSPSTAACLTSSARVRRMRWLQGWQVKAAAVAVVLWWWWWW